MLSRSIKKIETSSEPTESAKRTRLLGSALRRATRAGHSASMVNYGSWLVVVVRWFDERNGCGLEERQPRSDLLVGARDRSTIRSGLRKIGKSA